MTNTNKTTINVLSDSDVFIEDNCTYFKRFEILEGSEAADSLESGCIPREGDDGIIEYANIKISLDFVEKVYELAFGDSAIERGFSEADVIEKLKEMSDALAVLED